MAESYEEPVSFTSQEEVEQLLTSLGVDLRTLDQPGPASVVPYYVSTGTSFIWFFVSKSGTAAELAACPWVRMVTTVYAAMILTGHGGEPMNSSLVQQFEALKPQLQLVLERKVDPPGLVTANNYNGGIAVVNTQIDMQRLPQIRRVNRTSTYTPKGWRPPQHYPTQGWPLT